MRLSMLPVSIAAHLVAFAAFLIVPLAGGVEAPTPWPLSAAREFITAAPAPPPQQVNVLRASSGRTRRRADRRARPHRDLQVTSRPRCTAAIRSATRVPALMWACPKD